MNKRILPLMISSFFVLCAPAAMAGPQPLHSHQWPESVFGTVRDIRRNSIEIYDDHDKVLKTFICVNETDRWRKGDHVRIDFWPNGKIVEHIKRIRSSGHH